MQLEGVRAQHVPRRAPAVRARFQEGGDVELGHDGADDAQQADVAVEAKGVRSWILGQDVAVADACLPGPGVIQERVILRANGGEGEEEEEGKGG